MTSPPESESVAIVLGASATGLQVVRDLGRAGIGVSVADEDGSKPAFASKYATLPAIIEAGEDALIEQVMKLAASLPRRPVLVPSSDAFVQVLASHCERLSTVAELCSTFTPELVSPFLDKLDYAGFCKAAEISAPKVAILGDGSAAELLKEFELPLLLKPITGHLWRRRLKGRKLLEIHSADELRDAQNRFGESLEGFIAQELIPGDEDQIWVSAMWADADGTVRRQFVGRKLRQHPAGFGSASLAESRWNEDVAELSRRTVAASGFRGMLSTEFKFDARDNSYKAIEVNPRPSLWWGLVAASGVPLVAEATLAASGRSVELPTPGELREAQRDGVRWLFAEKDLATSLRYMFKGRLSPVAYAKSAFGADVRPVWSWDDRRPTVALLKYYISQAVSRSKQGG